MSPALLNNPGPLMLGGKPASTAVNDVIPLASDLVDHLSRANPTLTSLQTEAVRRELIAVIVQGLQVGIQLLDHRKLPTDQELDGIHTMTVQQALKGVPLSAILNLTNEGISTFRTLILSRADAEDSANLGDLNEFLFALAQRLHSFISISYLSALPAGSQLGEYSAGALVKAMLDGDDPTQLALQMGVELAPRYLVLRLLVNLPPIRPGARNGNHQRIQAYRDLSVAQSKNRGPLRVGAARSSCTATWSGPDRGHTRLGNSVRGHPTRTRNGRGGDHSNRRERRGTRYRRRPSNHSRIGATRAAPETAGAVLPNGRPRARVSTHSGWRRPRQLDQSSQATRRQSGTAADIVHTSRQRPASSAHRVGARPAHQHRRQSNQAHRNPDRIGSGPAL